MIALDCEWVPAIAPGDPRYIAIAAEAAKRSQPTTPEDYQALCCPPLCSLVAVGFLNTDSGVLRLGYDHARLDVATDDAYVPCVDETALLTWAHTTLDQFCRVAIGPRLVTFNGLAADLPVLWHRAVLLGVEPARALRRFLGAKPWETGPHLDLHAALRMNGQRYGLRTYALAYGLADPKAYGDGASVLDLVARRDGEALLRYLEADVRTTARLAEITARWLP